MGFSWKPVTVKPKEFLLYLYKEQRRVWFICMVLVVEPIRSHPLDLSYLFYALDAHDYLH